MSSPSPPGRTSSKPSYWALPLAQGAWNILVSSSIEAKLAPLKSQTGQLAPSESNSIDLEWKPQRRPGRPNAWSESSRNASIPSDLSTSESRAQLLHFFANHELLAVELFSWAILKYGEEWPDLAKGWVQTLSDEQRHFRLYQSRIRDLGFEFGDFAANFFFWDIATTCTHPGEFVSLVALTFEQANLDYCLHYGEVFTRVGDLESAKAIEEIYRDEIRHVRHGVHAIEKWKQSDSEFKKLSLWETYLRLLPPPISAARAKGIGFDWEGRAKAGLSREFVEEVFLNRDAKGRPPQLWWFSPNGSNASPSLGEVSADLEDLVSCLATPGDVQLRRRAPRREHRIQMKKWGFDYPAWVVVDPDKPFSSTPQKFPLISGIQAWEWDRNLWADARVWKQKLHPGLPETNAASLMERIQKPWSAPYFESKSNSSAWLNQYFDKHPEERNLFGLAPADAPEVISKSSRLIETLSDATASETTVLIKSPFGTAGRGIRTVEPGEASDKLLTWAKGLIRTQGAIVVEKKQQCLFDLSQQFRIQPDGTAQVLGLRQTLVSPSLAYQGTYLDSRLSGLPSNVRKELHQRWIPAWDRLLHSLHVELIQSGHSGPYGVDAFIFQQDDGGWALQPLVEVNCRFTMGHAALAVERHISPGSIGKLVLATKTWMDQTNWLANAETPTIHPKTNRIVTGQIPLGDPAQAKRMLPYLEVKKRSQAQRPKG